jgi:hypothetical protein
VRGLGPFLVLLGLGAAVVPVQRRVDAARSGLGEHDELLYLSSPRLVRSLFPGFEDLAADVYWLRTVQYFGRERLFVANPKFELLFPLVDITTTLDPRLEAAYRYGSIFLCEPRPAGAGQLQQGLRILEKGIAANPTNWRLRQDLGFYTFLFLHDAPKAAAIIEEASRVPGAAFWLHQLAADIMNKGGSRDVARRMWRDISEQAEEPSIRANAVQRLEVLDALDAADALTAQVEELAKRMGRRPDSLEELWKARLVRAPPVDASGAPYDYDPRTGRVRVSKRSRLWRPD